LYRIDLVWRAPAGVGIGAGTVTVRAGVCVRGCERSDVPGPATETWALHLLSALRLFHGGLPCGNCVKSMGDILIEMVSQLLKWPWARLAGGVISRVLRLHWVCFSF